MRWFRFLFILAAGLGVSYCTVPPDESDFKPCGCGDTSNGSGGSGGEGGASTGGEGGGGARPDGGS